MNIWFRVCVVDASCNCICVYTWIYKWMFIIMFTLKSMYSSCFCVLCLFANLDVYHCVFDNVKVSVYCLTFLWMFIIPFCQRLLYLLCM